MMKAQGVTPFFVQTVLLRHGLQEVSDEFCH